LEIDLFWLLALPLFFGLGWLAARHESRSQPPRGGELPAGYFRGLNFLLSDQPDRAIDAFIDVVRVDPETVELHFALGKLFRQRGENDRAIRVHQSLLDRADLDPKAREQALFELGLDFLKAGLLDRADQAFSRLESGPRAEQALRHRLEIAELVRDWPLAIALAARLPVVGAAGKDSRRSIVHFHCELAAKALATGDAAGFDRAAAHLADAEAIGSNHPRVALMRAELAMLRGEPERALQAWERLRQTHPDWFVLGARQWLQAHLALGRLDEGLATLESQFDSQRSIELFLALLDARLERDGARQAIAWGRTALARAPSLVGLDRLLDIESGVLESGARRDELGLTRGLLRHQVQRQSRYVCAHCGFRARQYYWQCPGCNRWESCAPQRAEELERV
jgi:lipopolysaccharide biosynthesis regulator YciM